MRKKEYKLGKLLYQEPPAIYHKTKRIGFVVILLSFFLGIFSLLLIIPIKAWDISKPENRYYLSIVGFVWMFFILPMFYYWISYAPFSIFECGFISNYGKVWFYNEIKKIKIDYVGYYKDKQPIGIVSFYKGRLLPLIIPFKGDANDVIKTYDAFLKHAIPAIKQSGGKIEFTYDELKKAFEYYNMDTTFLEELKYLFEDDKNKSVK